MAAPFTFVHAADLHLDTPFEGIGTVSPEVGRRLRDATLDSLDGLVDLCEESRAAFLVLAGDIYDGPEHGVRAQVRFLAALERLGRAGIEVFIAAGNHDPLAGGWSAIPSWPANVRLFGPRPESFAVTREGATLAWVHGMSYPAREVTENLAARFRRRPESGYQIGVLHATVGAPSGHAPYAPTTVEVLTETGLDYWALGHVHTRALLRDRRPVVAYPGNLQALSPRETGPRGAYVVRVDAGGEAVLSFHPLDRVRFRRETIDAAGMEGVADLAAKLREVASRARTEAGERSVVLTAEVSGRTALHAYLERPGQIDDLLRTLREEENPDGPFLWWNGIEGRTAPPVHPDRLRGQDSLSGAIVAACDRFASDPAALARFASLAWDDLARRPDAADLGPAPSEDELASLLEAARDLLLDRLHREESE